MILLIPFVGIAILLIFAVPISLYCAWAGSHLWSWFVVPAFGAPPLSILQLWGITLTLSMVRPKLNLSKSEVDWESGLVALLIAPLLALGIGYAIKFWWM